MAFDGTYNYTYDNEGNRTARIKYHTPDDDTSGIAQRVTYTWDHRNRLTDMVVEEDQSGTLTVVGTADYGYNNENHRVFASIDTDGDTIADIEEYFMRDGMDLLLVSDDAGAVIDRYLNGVRTSEVLAEEAPGTPGSEVRWILSDHQRSTRDVVINDTGAGLPGVVNHVIYSSFGQIDAQTDAAELTRHAYTGQEYDGYFEVHDADQAYYKARYYDQDTAKFLSQDPIGFESGDHNLYRYVGNNPLNYIDPTGLEGEDAGEREEKTDPEQSEKDKSQELVMRIRTSPWVKETDRTTNSIQDIIGVEEDGKYGDETMAGVRSVQQELINNGFMDPLTASGRDASDGKWGDQTERAYQAMLSANKSASTDAATGASSGNLFTVNPVRQGLGGSIGPQQRKEWGVTPIKQVELNADLLYAMTLMTPRDEQAKVAVFNYLQEGILDGIADNMKGYSDADQKWTGNVVADFMDPFLKSMDEYRQGKPISDPGWNTTIGGLKGMADDGAWTGGHLANRTRQIMNSREMALNHINQDLRNSLMKNGVGSQAVWKDIGNVVNAKSKAVLSPQGVWAGEKLGGDFDVAKIRDNMRKDVAYKLSFEPGGRNADPSTH